MRSSRDDIRAIVWEIFFSISPLFSISLLILSNSILREVIISWFSSLILRRFSMPPYSTSKLLIELSIPSNCLWLSSFLALKSSSLLFNDDNSLLDLIIFFSLFSFVLIRVFILSKSIFKFVIDSWMSILILRSFSIPSYLISKSLIDWLTSSNLFLCWSLFAAELDVVDETTKPSHRHKSPSLETSLCPKLKSIINLGPSSFFTSPVCFNLLFTTLEPLIKFERGSELLGNGNSSWKSSKNLQWIGWSSSTE